MRLDRTTTTSNDLTADAAAPDRGGLVRRVRGSIARLGWSLAPVAGRPLSRACSMSTVSNRGNVLVLVLGTLALMSVVAAIYVAIGQSDRRTAQATRQSVAQRDVVQDVATHLSGVIRDDVFSAYPVQVGTGTSDADYRLYRESHDYPYTDFTVTSDINFGGNAVPFHPAGTHLLIDTGSFDYDFTVASDPWLASTEPTFLGRMDFPGAGIGLDDRLAQVDTLTERWADNRDWWQISNFAPDGRFVNLHNLRNNFDAESGFGFDNLGLRRISQGLTLFTLNGDGVLQASNTRVDGVNISSDLEQRRPANFTMFQRGAAFPIGQSVFALGTNGDVTSWASTEFPLYQWADADGDGIADSRWFELVNASDPNAPTNLLGSSDIRYFMAARAIDLSSMANVNTASDQLAAAIQFLDQGLPGGDNHKVAPARAGATPAEVDLRRILMNTDAAERHTQLNSTNRLSYADFEAVDPNRTLGEDYTDIGPGGAAITSAISFDPANTTDFTMQGLGAMGYAAMSEALQTGATPSPASVGPGEVSTAAVGITLDDASRWDSSFFRTNAELDRITAAPNPDNFDRFQRERSRRRMVWYHVNAQFSGPESSFASATDGGPGPNQAVSMDQITGFDITQFGTPTGIRRFDELHDFEAGFFGIEDLEELLTFRSVNNPVVSSRLERTLDGRLFPFTTLGPLESELLAIGPMRSGRSLLAERGGRDSDGFLPAGVLNPDPTLTPDGSLDYDALAHITLDVRQRLTTISGSRPIIGGIPADEGLRFREYVGSVISPGRQFPEIASALAPGLTSNEADLWSGLEHTQTDTLFYGGRGPEAALNIAAHLAVNLPAEFGAQQFDGPYTLIVDNTIRAELDADLNDINNLSLGAQLVHDQDFPELGWAAARIAGTTLDLDPGASTGGSNDLLADAGEFTNPSALYDGDITYPVVNVYPMRAHPVITSVATFSVFTDASEITSEVTPITSTLSMSAANASPDYPDYIGDGADFIPNDLDFASDPQLSILDCNDLQRTTIDSSVNRTNADHIASVLAIQLTNPFDEPVTLWRDPFGDATRQIDIADLQDNASGELQVAGRSPEYYYLEYAGKYYELAEVRERLYSVDPTGPGTLEPFDISNNEDIDEEPVSFENDGLVNRYYPTTGGGNVEGTVTLHPISIAAGESVVVYVLSEREKHVSARFAHANKRIGRNGLTPIDLEDGAGNTDAFAVRAWIQNQLGSNGLRAIQIPQVSVVTTATAAADPATAFDAFAAPENLEFGYYNLRDSDFNDPLEPRAFDPDLPEADIDSVKLWRAVRAEVAGVLSPDISLPTAGENQQVVPAIVQPSWFGGPSVTFEQPVYRSNNLINDQLVERFRLDGTELRNRGRLAAGAGIIEIPGTGYTGAFLFDSDLRAGDALNCMNADMVIAAAGWDTSLYAQEAAVLASQRSLNLGYTITTWAETGRNAPDGVTGSQPNEVLSTLGGVPYYMLEPKDPADPTFRRDFTQSAVPSMNPLSRDVFDTVPSSSRGGRTLQLGDPLTVAGPAGFATLADTTFTSWLFEQSGGRVFAWLSARDSVDVISPGGGGGGIAQSENIGTRPGERNGDVALTSSWLNPSGAPTPFNELEFTLPADNQFDVPSTNPAGQIASVQQPLYGSNIDARAIDLNPRRLADLFNALGIGPRHTPYRNAGGTLERINVIPGDPTSGEDHERTWLTAGEALALALGYERTNSTDLTTLDERNRGALRIFGWDAPAATPFAAPATDHRRVLEAGRIRPLAYSPFFDITEDYIFDPTAGDIAFGDGLTPGMRLLESYRGLNTLVGGEDDSLGVSFGTININTASEATLRAIGLWTPSLARRTNPSAGADPLYDYWPLREPVEFAGSGGQTAIALNTVEEETGLPVLALPGTAQPIDEGVVLNVPAENRLDIPDVAATVAAYRDRMWGDYRPASIPGNAATNLSPNAGFDHDSFFGYPAVYPGSANPLGWLNRNFRQDTGTLQASGRGFQTGIDGLREQPGFASLGELIAVTAPADATEFDARYGTGIYTSGTVTATGIPNQRDAIRHVLMDYLGYDTTGAGLNPDPRPLGPGLESSIDIDTGDADTDANEFDERFAMANTAFNLLSVSSDYYAVYFVLHGYRRTDVEGLRTDDPMLPSVARRFLMILDRTNVESPGDAPKVLLLREVPL